MSPSAGVLIVLVCSDITVTGKKRAAQHSSYCAVETAIRDLNVKNLYSFLNMGESFRPKCVYLWQSLVPYDLQSKVWSFCNRCILIRKRQFMQKVLHTVVPCAFLSSDLITTHGTSAVPHKRTYILFLLCDHPTSLVPAYLWG